MMLARQLLPLLVPLSLTSISAQAGPKAPSAPQVSQTAPEPLRAIAAAVASAIQHGHYTPPPIDDAFSARWFDRYLDNLDPNRLYFTQADVQRLRAAYRTRLDDDILSPRPTLAAAWDIHKVYVQRVSERVSYALSLIDRGGITFDDPDRTFTLDRSEADWPSRSGLDAVWKDRVAEQILRMALNDVSHEDAKTRLTRRFERILQDVTTMEDLDVLEGWLGAFTRTFDPHSAWFKPISKANFDIEMSDKLIGIGARLQIIEGYTTIADLIAGGPAEKGGDLHAGDRIIAVAQKGEEPVDVVDMRLDRVVQLIRGEKGSVVELTIHPHDAADPSATRVISITREEVKLADAAASGQIEQVDGRSIGVIDIPSFYIDSDGKRRGEPYGSTSTDTARILEDFKSSGVQAVVLDLRRNTGGALDQALETTGLFLPGGPVVQVRDRSGEVQVLKDPSREVVWEGPLVVLTSEASASASEILAAAIQDYRRGVIVGGPTHGKGTVQNLLSLDRYLRRIGEDEASTMAGALKFTSHMFYRVNGASTQVEGVKPDVALPSVFAGLKIKESDLDNPLPWHTIQPAKVRASTTPFDLEPLRTRSAQRVSESMEFAFLLEDLMRREIDRDRAQLSLHRPTREAEINRRKLIDEARQTARRLAGSDPEDPPDAILVEATHIAADLVQQAGT